MTAKRNVSETILLWAEIDCCPLRDNFFFITQNYTVLFFMLTVFFFCYSFKYRRYHFHFIGVQHLTYLCSVCFVTVNECLNVNTHQHNKNETNKTNKQTNHIHDNPMMMMVIYRNNIVLRSAIQFLSNVMFYSNV